MISNSDAIQRLKSRDRYLQTKVEELMLQGRETRYFLMDREALALAISALEFVISTLEYESSALESSG